MKEHFANGTYGMIGLLLFFGLFVGIMAWLFWPGKKDKFTEYGNIPLKDETHEQTDKK